LDITPAIGTILFQAVIVYWGGHAGTPSNCNGSFTQNCLMFQYALDTSTLSTYAPGIGDLSSGSSLSFSWNMPSANCYTPVPGDDVMIVLSISDNTADVSTTYETCFAPWPTYVQFLEERPHVGNQLAEGPQFGTHDFTAWAYNLNGNQEPLNYFLVTWKINMVNCNSQSLVTATVLSNYATYSTWKDTWVASSSC